MSLLSVENLKVHFPIRSGAFSTHRGVVKAVDDLTLNIGTNETVALVGESGCGKSTTGNAILGFAPVTDGKISFQGRDLSKLTRKERAEVWQEMQVIFQDPVSALNPRRTIAQSIAEPLEINGYPKPEIRSRVVELMKLVGLNEDQFDRRPEALSGGQRQRVVIARSLALKPKLVICDEPVSALDVSIQSQILNLMVKLQNELGLSYLFISHDLSVVRHIADRVVIMYLGNIVEEGPAVEIFANPQHPYTKALLSAIPRPNPAQRGIHKRTTLIGDLPSPIDPPKGCPFVTRCPVAEARCVESRPKLDVVSKQHKCRCFLRGQI